MSEQDRQYNLIERYFRNTVPSYHDLDWDGNELLVFFNNEIIERYFKEDLKEIIKGF